MRHHHRNAQHWLDQQQAREQQQEAKEVQQRVQHQTKYLQQSAMDAELAAAKLPNRRKGP